MFVSQKTSTNKQMQLEVKFVDIFTYQQLLRVYDEEFFTKIEPLDHDLLIDPVFVFELDLQCHNLHWKLWKNKGDLIMLLKNIDDQVNEIKMISDQMDQNDKEIIQLHQKLKGMFDFNQAMLHAFARYLKLLGSSPLTKNNDNYLRFLDYCTLTDQCNLKIYTQIVLDQESNKNFITVTSDAILRSNEKLLDSKVESITPFTSQLRVTCEVDQEKFLTFIISVSVHEKLVLKFYKNYAEALNFNIALKMALQQSSYHHLNRFTSFAPTRENCSSKLYHYSAQYFEDIYQQLMDAKEQVCMTGWMITPYILLKRPNSIENKEYRLDGVLEKIAHRGVKIFVIVFRQSPLFANSDSEHVQDYFESLHENIKVYRHPNGNIPFLWSLHEKLVIVDQQICFLGGLDIAYGRWDTPQYHLSDPSLLWDGREYNNYRVSDIYNPRNYKEPSVDKDKHTRLPWHDIGMQFRGDAVLDVVRHFVQKWYFVKAQLLTDPVKTWQMKKQRYNQILTATKDQSEREQTEYYLKSMKKQEEQASFKENLTLYTNGRQEIKPSLLVEKRTGSKAGSQTLQICRSVAQWSVGVSSTETSIHEAHLQLIKESQHFIYIQNQFFMGLKNKIVEYLVERITRAYKKGEKFRVIVVVPLLPGYDGDITDPDSATVRIHAYHNYNAICRGGNSLLEQLSFIPNLRDYIEFYSLRQSELVNGVPATEILYIHSKLMIVDDKRCIIGSANIYDRSMLGDRDSELICVIEQNQGNILGLRCRLFNMHFGLSEEETKNIVEPQVWGKVQNNARNSTLFYRQVFGCLPDDNVTVAAEAEKLKKCADITKYNKGRKDLVGYAVQFPLHFLENQHLGFNSEQKESMAPEASYA